MLAVVGTVPESGFPLLAGRATLQDDHISIQGKRTTVNRGTPALLAAAAKVAQTLGQEEPFAYLIGDIGRGDGSRKLYEYLLQHLKQGGFHTIAFHYVQPLVEWHERILATIKEMRPEPVLIADAGYMYMAKMSRQSAAYDLFTPDIGELAFLADDSAPHPFYTRGFILHEQDRVPDLISKVYGNGNAPRHLLVKGIKDYVVSKEGVQGVIDSPVEESMEAIGGTGDTLTGIVSALSASGMSIKEAAIVAARTNRIAGSYAHPTPATQVAEIIRHIPEALRSCLKENK